MPMIPSLPYPHAQHTVRNIVLALLAFFVVLGLTSLSAVKYDQMNPHSPIQIEPQRIDPIDKTPWQF